MARLRTGSKAMDARNRRAGPVDATGAHAWPSYSQVSANDLPSPGPAPPNRTTRCRTLSYVHAAPHLADGPLIASGTHAEPLNSHVSPRSVVLSPPKTTTRSRTESYAAAKA